MTATRKLASSAAKVPVRRRVEQWGEIYGSVSEVTTGGAPGGDTYILGLARALYPDAYFRLVLPKEPGNVALVRAFEQALANGSVRGEIVWTGKPPLDRNDDILDGGDVLEAFPRQDTEPANPRVGGGTWATVRRARKRAMPIAITPAIGDDDE